MPKPYQKNVISLSLAFNLPKLISSSKTVAKFHAHFKFSDGSYRGVFIPADSLIAIVDDFLVYVRASVGRKPVCGVEVVKTIVDDA